MKTYCFFCLLLCWLLAVPPTAPAKGNTLYHIAIPHDWSTEKQENSTVYMHPEEICAITVSIAPHQNIPFRELAIAFYENLEGKKANNDDGGMTFSLHNEENIPATARLTIQGANYMLVTASGNCKNLQKILDSITMHNTGPRPFPLL